MPDDTQVDLKQTIAELRRELGARTTERDEALARETAMAEVLGVINSSPGDLAPVFDTILEKAVGLCEAAFGQLATYDGEFFRFMAVRGEAPFVEEQRARGPLPPSFGVTWPRIVRGEGVVHIADAIDTDLYRSGHEGTRRGVDIGGIRSLLTVALRKERFIAGCTVGLPARGAAVFRQANCTAAKFRCTGGDCHRKCAAHHGDARGPGAADRHRRGIAGHQFLARRPRAGL